MYESRREKPLPVSLFAQRLIIHFFLASAVVGLVLIAGMAGYHRFESLGWRDSFLNAAMLLGGASPVHVPQTGTGRLFTGAFALISRLVFIAAAGILLAPVVHRIFHTIHWDR